MYMDARIKRPGTRLRGDAGMARLAPARETLKRAAGTPDRSWNSLLVKSRIPLVGNAKCFLCVHLLVERQENLALQISLQLPVRIFLLTPSPQRVAVLEWPDLPVNHSRTSGGRKMAARVAVQGSARKRPLQLSGETETTHSSVKTEFHLSVMYALSMPLPMKTIFEIRFSSPHSPTSSSSLTSMTV